LTKIQVIPVLNTSADRALLATKKGERILLANEDLHALALESEEAMAKTRPRAASLNDIHALLLRFKEQGIYL
jgi:hypothetical protein